MSGTSRQQRAVGGLRTRRVLDRIEARIFLECLSGQNCFTNGSLEWAKRSGKEADNGRSGDSGNDRASATGNFLKIASWIINPQSSDAVPRVRGYAACHRLAALTFRALPPRVVGDRQHGPMSF